MNKKSKIKAKIQRIRDNGEMFDKVEDMCEVLNRNFQSVFVDEGETVVQVDQELNRQCQKLEDVELDTSHI